VDEQAALMALIRAIVHSESDEVTRCISEQPELASLPVVIGATRANAPDYFFNEITHYVYAGDTALHLAAASYADRIVGELVAAGAVVDAVNRRGARPLHYAVDGGPGAPHRDRAAQHATIARLLELGADPNAPDKNGTPPLHRAIRNRSATAVEALLAGGADPHRRNGTGSSVMQLATWTTGKGGSGSDAARAEQEVIIRLLTDAGAQ
jgi:ankyrin repeat protein